MKLLRLLLPVLTVVGALRADIAPTTFTGTDIYPLQSTEIRMAEADVHIVWGMPTCSLEARFSMVNETDRQIEAEVGFPVGAYHPNSHGDYLSGPDDEEPSPSPPVEVGPEVITIIVNGTRVPAYRRLPPDRIKEIKWKYASWYFAKVGFAPGANTVAVTTRLNPSASGLPCKLRLSYCISTGGRWSGPIGREAVTISFPGATAAQLLEGSPITKGGRAEGDSIRWEFSAFEPQGDDHDIELDFYPPTIAAKLLELRAAHERQPTDSAAALRYATHLFCLGRAKGNSGFPPQELTAGEFREVLALLDSENDKQIFLRFYRPSGDAYASDSTEWTPDRKEMVRILADGNFCSKYEGIDHVLAAKALVEQCLARNPHDADAWNLYLTHFWRFSFAARGHWFGASVYSKPLKAAIASAIQNCPDDPRLRAWHTAMLQNGHAPTLHPDEPKRAADAFVTEFPTLDIRYY